MIVGASVIFLLLICLVIGHIVSKRYTHFEEFALSRNHFGSLALTATIIATFVGGTTMIGVAEKAFTKGFLPAYALLGFSLQLLLTALVIVPRMSSLPRHVMTLEEMFGHYYNPILQTIMSGVWLIYSVGLLSVQLAALSHLLEVFIPWQPEVIMAATMACTVLYCMLGGIRAVVATDILQVLLMFVVVIIIGATAFYALPSGNLLEQLPPHFFTPSNNDASYLLAAWFGFVAGDALLPPLMQRLMMSDKIETIKRASLLSSIGIIPLFTLMAFSGIACAALNPSGDPKGVMSMIHGLSASPWFGATMIIGLSAAVLSTMDSFLHTASMSIVRTFLPYLNRDLSERRQILYARISLVIIGAISVIIATSVTSIFDALLLVYSIWGPAFMIPVAAMCYQKLISPKQLLSVLFLSALTVLLWHVFALETILIIDGLMAGVLVNAIAYGWCFANRKKEHPVRT